LSWSREGYFAPPQGLFEMLEGKHPIMTAILFRRELIDTLGVFDPSITTIDLEFEFRIAAHRPFVVSQKPCGIFLLHSGSLSMISQAAFLYNDYPKMIDKFRKDEQLSSEFRNQIEERLTKFFQKVTFRSGMYFIAHQ